MKTVPSFLRLAPLAVLLLALASPARAAGAPDGAAMVGEATLVIGVARLISTDGVERLVDRGTAIRVGDRIETGAGGHVHLRFVDGARLSVRPASRLQVENYSRASDASALTAIKFRLDEGVVRSITGAWGEAERDRFRLNTPVAAIGVKGTDFVVKSDGETTLASVYTGAIMLTPIAGIGCQASFGPCLNGSEKLLSEDMKGQMLSLSRQQATPQLVPAVDLLAQRVVRPVMAEVTVRPDLVIKPEVNPVASPVVSRTDTSPEKTVVSESRVTEMVAVQVASAAQLTQPVVPPVVTPTQPVAPVQPVTPVVPVQPIAPVVVVTPVTPVTPVVLPPVVTQLVWARMAEVAPDGDSLSRSFAQAIEGGRQGTVGNFAYSLYREVSATAPVVLASADTSANFRLAGSAAQLTMPSGRSTVSEAVQVNNGTLSVDFAHSTYATQLNVSNARIGVDSVTSNGIIKSNGVLLGQGGNAYTAGALSLDGKEAGYFFEKTLAAGQLTGLTLWGR
ncbi:MAG: FecR family protein [Burkholderiales bacterium]|nr:FecR family protein [Burkholderiales bacterium]